RRGGGWRNRRARGGARAGGAPRVRGDRAGEGEHLVSAPERTQQRGGARRVVLPARLEEGPVVRGRQPVRGGVRPGARGPGGGVRQAGGGDRAGGAAPAGRTGPAGRGQRGAGADAHPGGGT